MARASKIYILKNVWNEEIPGAFTVKAEMYDYAERHNLHQNRYKVEVLNDGGGFPSTIYNWEDLKGKRLV